MWISAWSSRLRLRLRYSVMSHDRTRSAIRQSVRNAAPQEPCSRAPRPWRAIRKSSAWTSAVRPVGTTGRSTRGIASPDLKPAKNDSTAETFAVGVRLSLQRNRMDARDWRFPTPCPICDAMAGTPYHVQTVAPTLTLALRCGDCGHEWEISRRHRRYSLSLARIVANRPGDFVTWVLFSLSLKFDDKFGEMEHPCGVTQVTRDWRFPTACPNCDAVAGRRTSFKPRRLRSLSRCGVMSVATNGTSQRHRRRL